MNMWFVQIHYEESPFATKGQFFVSSSAFELAHELSRANPGRDVTVSALSRVRMTVRDEKIVSEHADITKFYTNISAQQQHNWVGGHELERDED